MSRVRIGETGINWKLHAFGLKKYRRKTIGWGQYDKRAREWEDEIYIRELSILDGGIGCALWDASIVLARFFHLNFDLFAGLNVLELGAGCGLPGICLARVAKKVFLTDYLDSLITNLEYNVMINENFDDLDPNLTEEVKLRKCRVGETAVVRKLDWYDVRTSPDLIFDAIDQVRPDFLLGSELTYTLSEDTVECLTSVLELLMTPNSVFMEILSTDRDGVDSFLLRARDQFEIRVFDAVNPLYFVNLEKITGQRPERYRFYLLRKKASLDAEDAESEGEDHVAEGLFERLCARLERDQQETETEETEENS